MAIHVAEEARHISFAHEYLRKRVPRMRRRSRFWLSLYVPTVMRVLCQAIVVPPRSFFKEFDIPRSVRKELFFDAPDSRQTLRDMFGDVRNAMPRRGVDEPPRAVDVAHLQDRRSPVAVSQRAAARAPADPGRGRLGSDTAHQAARRPAHLRDAGWPNMYGRSSGNGRQVSRDGGDRTGMARVVRRQGRRRAYGHFRWP